MTSSARPHALRSTLRQTSGQPGTPVVLLDNVTRVFGVAPGIVRVDLRVERGEVLLVRGPNGAGKSTLLRVMATVLSPTYGSGSVLGFDLVRDRAEIRRGVELLGHRTRLYEDLTARENLRFACRLYGIGAEGVGAALDRVGLSDAADERVHGYSQGMRQRVALARVLVRRPEVLLLDEPYAGLDEQAKQLVDEVIDEARTGGRTVVLATHDQGRGEMATRTISMDAGGIVPVPHAREASPAPIPIGEVQGAGVG